MRDLSSYSQAPSAAASGGIDSPSPSPGGSTSDPAPTAGNGGAASGVGTGEPDASVSASVDASTVGVSTDAGSPSELLACNAAGELPTGGGCYLLGAQAISWAAASAACEAWGGGLARIDSAGEEAELLAARAAPADAWIGLSDVAVEGTMLWEDGGAPDPYTNWADLQPDDLDGSEDCVELLADGRGWNDRPCADLRVYLCER